MKMRADLILMTITLIFFGCLGVISGVGGLLIFGFGLLANEPQLPWTQISTSCP